MPTDEARRALLITPSFFGYERDILRELERQGYEPILLDERPSNRPLARAVMRVRKGLLSRQIERYFRAKLAALESLTLDVVVVIKAEVVPRWFLEELRRRNVNARFVFYTYDAIANASNCLGVLDLFDERLSFDSDDVCRRDDLAYLPLFYTPEFAGGAASTDRTYSLTFVGTLHSSRYAYAQRLLNEVRRSSAFFYVQARWYFAVAKYLTREHREVPWADVSFAPLDRSEIARMFRHSKAVLDLQRPGQSGLTMRSFEVLAAGAILVTTNAAIKNEPFFDPRRVLIVPPNVDELVPADVVRELDTLPAPDGPPPGFDAYSLESWVRTLVEAQ